MTPKDAIECLSAAFQADPDYAHGWHCNIAMSFFDAFPKDAGIHYSIVHATANDAAERFMFAAFGARNTSNPNGNNIALDTAAECKHTAQYGRTGTGWICAYCGEIVQEDT